MASWLTSRLLALTCSRSASSHRNADRQTQVTAAHPQKGLGRDASSGMSAWCCGRLAIGVLGGAVSQLPRFVRAPCVAARARPAGGNCVEARRQLVRGCLVVDPPAPEMRPGLLGCALDGE